MHKIFSPQCSFRYFSMENTEFSSASIRYGDVITLIMSQVNCNMSPYTPIYSGYLLTIYFDSKLHMIFLLSCQSELLKL